MICEYAILRKYDLDTIILTIKAMLHNAQKSDYSIRDNYQFRVGAVIYRNLMSYTYSCQDIASIYGIKVKLDYNMIPNEIILEYESLPSLNYTLNYVSAEIKKETTLPEKYIVNDKATILFWEDGTKTIVKKSKNDIFDPIKSYLWAYFQKHSGMSKTQANKYLAEINDNN